MTMSTPNRYRATTTTLNNPTVSAGTETTTPSIEAESKSAVDQIASPDDEVRRLQAALDGCDRVNEQEGFFTGSEIRRAKSLEPAYRLYHLCQTSKPDVVENFIKNEDSIERKRAPSARKPAMFAIIRSFRPEGEEQQKLCSDLTYFLVHAYDCGKLPGEFYEWATGITQKECKRKVRDKRREIRNTVAFKKKRHRTDPITSSTKIDVVIRLNGTKKTCSLFVSEVNAGRVSALFSERETISGELLLEILHAIRNERGQEADL